jgi:membrane protein DedA with SNARE-associated domain
MSELAIRIITDIGYLGIAALMFLEIVFPPIPSEVVMPFAGFAAAEGYLSLSLVILLGSIGSLLGSLVIYGFGVLVKEEHVEGFVKKYGKYIGLNVKALHRGHEWFDAHGFRFVLFGRMIPGVRSFVSLPAGIKRMKLVPFLAYSAVGSTAWTALLATGGFLLGDAYMQVEQYIGTFGGIVMVAIVLGVAVLIYKNYAKK